MFPRLTQHVLAIYLAITFALLLLGSLWLLQPAPPSHAQSQPDALGSVSGTVRNAQGDPLPNILVLLEHYKNQFSSRAVKSDQAGGFQFLAQQSGTYRLRFVDQQGIYVTKYYANADLADDATTFTVNGNDVTGINMELHEGGSISITLQSVFPVTATYNLTLFRQTPKGGWASYRNTSSTTNNAHFDNLPSGNYRLCADAYYGTWHAANIECYDNARPETFGQVAPNATNIQVQTGAETAVAMTLGDSPQIEGYILTRDDQPLADIAITLSPVGPYPGSYPQQVAKTNSNGYFSFGFITAGNYNLTFNSHSFGLNAFLPTYYPDERFADRAGNLLIDSTTYINVTRKLARSSHIFGKVTLPDNVPVEWATISLYRQRPDGSWGDSSCDFNCPLTMYDAETGAYTVTQITGGRYRVRADAYISGSSNYFFAYYGGDSFEDAETVEFTTGGSAKDINITIGDAHFDGSITGIVTADGVPRPGIEVGLFWQYNPSTESPMPLFTTTTDAQGRYRLEGLSFGHYQVGFRDPQGVYATTFYSGATALNNALFVPMTQTGTIENINAELTPGSTIRGRILTQNGKQASDFVIQVLAAFPEYYNFYPVAYTDEKSGADGSFEITGLVSGTYYLRAHTPVGSGDYPQPFTLYYPEGDYPTQWLVVGAGQTVENKNIFVRFLPNYFLPLIGGGAAVQEPGFTPLPTVAPTETPFSPPPPTPTPAIP